MTIEDADARENEKSPDETKGPVHPRLMQRQLRCARILTDVTFGMITTETGLSVGVIRSCEGDEFLNVGIEEYTKLRDYYESMGVIFIDRGLKLAKVV